MLPQGGKRRLMYVAITERIADGFAGNQGDAFCNFILHHIEHDSGNKEDLSEDFISHYSQHE
jgi:hypothetical protein